ncbi:MAG: TetR family transcriptional regulator, partial [Agromyces sp.]
MNATRLSRPIGRRAGRSTTRASILEAALEQFSQRGFNGTSIRRIAAAADVDASLVTHYFGTKDALLRACIEEVGAGPA